MAVHIFVPRWMDRADTNAQNFNAKALLSRFSDPRASWTTISGKEPADAVRKEHIKILPLSRSRWWQYHLALAYQSKFDAVFYPGPHWGDEIGLKFRSLVTRRTPIISTIEGIIATPASVQKLSSEFGHPVYSQPGTDDGIPRIRWLYGTSDHIIAISPFLAQVAKSLYGDKVSCLPLGIEDSIFHSVGRQEPGRCRVVSCGTVKHSKNPEIFLRLADRFREADFVWFGGGSMGQQLADKAKRLKLENLRFPGMVQPETLADEFRRSSIFVLPSHSEGAPKVVQEAVACGLPVVLNGFFESPAVVHGRNGLVAWSDEQLIEQVGTLTHAPGARSKMGRCGVEIAKDWTWDRIAPQWEELIIRLVTKPSTA